MDLPDLDDLPADLNAIRGGLDRLIGLELLELGAEEATARVTITDDIKQPLGLVHGGIYASVAETLTSIATALAVRPEGKSAQGLSNATSFLRPMFEGTVHARAVRLHRGRTTWVWDVECTDDEGRRCAITRMTIAVREPVQPR